MSLFNTYTGTNFLALNLPPREWLVENLMRKGDSAIIVGNEKSGKSVFMFQLICSLTTCHPFIDKYTVPKPAKVVYVQLEGELSDSQERFKRMIKTIDINPELFTLMFQAPLELQIENHATHFVYTIIKHLNPNILQDNKGKLTITSETIKPDIVIIDPLYFAYTGSLNDDGVVRAFIGNLRKIKDYLNCAILLVHHTHKQKWTYTGDKIDEGDEAIFGSKFFKAWADHTLLFNYDIKNNVRVLSCNTQRSGDIVRECNLRLVSGNNTSTCPLYFEETDMGITNQEAIIETLSKPEYIDGLTPEDIMDKCKLKRNTFYKSIKLPLANGKIIKVIGTRPIRYKLNESL